MILEDIQQKLEEVDPEIHYGMADAYENETLWNYIVFHRSIKKASSNKTGYSDYFTVHLVRENWIPEGLEEEVIKKMLEVKGMRLAGTDGTYDYTRKPNTDVVVEAFSIDFVLAKKV